MDSAVRAQEDPRLIGSQHPALVTSFSSTQSTQPEYEPTSASLLRTASMTPPPSSQVDPLARGNLRTPPLTVRENGMYEHAFGHGGLPYSEDMIENASTDELRAMFGNMNLALKEARASAAHYKLQYNMLLIDSSEASNRMAVELEMAQKEAEVFQWSEERRKETEAQTYSEPNLDPANTVLVTELSRQCRALQTENEELKVALQRATRLTDGQEGDIARLTEENERLRWRIRENRDHLNKMRRVHGMYDGVSRDLESPQTASRHLHNKLSRAPDVTPGRGRGGDQPFAALLLADQVLSQGTATAPATPAKPSTGRGKAGHQRGVHSLSSLPATPRRGQNAVINVPRTPPMYEVNPSRAPQTAPVARYISPSSRRRRRTSDSTISISETDIEKDSQRHEPTVTESQASLAASSMLRGSPPRSAHKKTAKSGGSGLTQSKLFGQVKKSNIDRSAQQIAKKALQTSPSENDEPQSKRARVGEAVGLGIGGIGGGQ